MIFSICYKRPTSGVTKSVWVTVEDGETRNGPLGSVIRDPAMVASKIAGTFAAVIELLKKGYLEYGVTRHKSKTAR